MRDRVVLGLSNDRLRMIGFIEQRRVTSEYCKEFDWTNSSAEEDRWPGTGFSSVLLPPGRAGSGE